MDFNEKSCEAENLSSMDLLPVGWSLQETGIITVPFFAAVRQKKKSILHPAFQGPIPGLIVIRWKASEACLKSDSIPG